MYSRAVVHPSAIVEPGAELAPDVEVGPLCHVGPHVRLARGVRLVSHVVVAGRTRIGAGTVVYPFASLGLPPQDRKFAGEPSRLEVGARNVIREYATMHLGTAGDRMVTTVGDDGLFMVGSHIGHDSRVGDHVVLTNHVSLGGHTSVGDHVMVGAASGLHQFARIGAHAVVGASTPVRRDVVPFALCTGDEARIAGLNLVGLRRRGFDNGRIRALQRALERLFARAGTLEGRLSAMEREFAGHPDVAQLVAFARAPSKRGLARP